jgi:acylglycerol lipase
MKASESYFNTKDGQSLYFQKWVPGEVKACLLLVHGLGEHSSRYNELSLKMSERGIAVFSFDGRGHGKSVIEKPNAYIANYEYYLDDSDEMVTICQNNYSELPLFLMGHSMGGGMVAAYLLKYSPKVNGVVLSSSLLKPSSDVSKLLILASGLLSFLLPKIKTIKVDSTKLSHDLEVVKNYQSDPLVYQDGLPARTGHELLKMMRFIQNNVLNFKTPILMVHGTGDMLTPVEGTEDFYQRINSEDKTCLIYPELYHELFNELSKEEITHEVINWIVSRFPING